MDEADILLDQQNADAVMGEPDQEGRQFIDDDGRQPLARFVENEQIRVCNQRPANREHLLLAARQRQPWIVAPLAQNRECLVNARQRPGTGALGRRAQQQIFLDG
jgi:hypothetical protein